MYFEQQKLHFGFTLICLIRFIFENFEKECRLFVHELPKDYADDNSLESLCSLVYINVGSNSNQSYWSWEQLILL